ncbi:MAG: acylneuraminate cytidylyltransferase family protein [Lachnospiraceae bacterium]|nr:acylneuraminate cytidylyltransferase family protein [Lachnospiraceae bacterium]
MKQRMALIPARGGSKGIPRKNIYLINNKPLIAYSIEAGLEAKEAGVVDRVIVSTEDEEIAEISRQYGAEVPFLRPAELASDKSKSVDCMIHAFEFFKEQGKVYDDIVLLQPTSPLRNGEDIINSIKVYDESGSESLVSCYLEESVSVFNSYYLEGNLGIALDENHNKGKRRQDLPPMYVRNGAIFITNTDYMLRTKLVVADKPAVYVMPHERSVNIDTIYDMKLTEWMVATQNEH